MTPEHVKRAADRAAMRSEGRDPGEAPTDAGQPSNTERSATLAPRRQSRARGWPISLSFLGLVGALLGSTATMLAFPAYAHWGVFPLVLAGWLVSLCLHEFGHAIVAYHSGDRSMRAKGYLTLDLLRYTHLQYSIVLPLAFLALGGIGLPGGAVYVNMRSLRSRLRRTLVSAGGPVATVAVLASLLVILRAGSALIDTTPALYEALAFLAFLQLTTLIFNLLPVPGLDGWGILGPWLPRKMRELGWRAAGMAPLLLIVLLFLPPVNRAFWSGVYVLSVVVGIETWAIVGGRSLFEFWR
jgi:Zn-dependent protease